MTEAHDPYWHVRKQTDEVLGHAVSVPPIGNAKRSVAKLPNEPPVIETLYPSSTGLPPGVIDEWGGKNLLRSETDDRNQRKLHVARSKWGVAR